MATMLIGVKSFETDEVFNRKLAELRELAFALGIQIDYEMVQNLPKVNDLSYLGSGKMTELQSFIETQAVKTIIFNDELSARQFNYIQDLLEVEILDRTSLILAIFERRAHTKEAVLQVEIAKLTYQLPRLVGSHQEMSGQMGGSGFRGAGETQLELDRRQLYTKLQRLKQELARVVKQRKTQRRQRQTGSLPIVSLVGYTNSGKSTLMNTLMKESHKEDKTVFEKDMLFATLETSTRLVNQHGKLPFLLTDTVGFISYLPHVLVEAFKSTLEEIKESDLLLHVIDVTDENYLDQINTTKQVLEEIGAKDIPVLYLYNKVDMGGYAFVQTENPHLFISAKQGTNLDSVYRYIRKTLYPSVQRVQLWIPYEDSAILSDIHHFGEVISERYQEEGIYLVVEVLPHDLGKLQDYLIKN